LARGRGSLGRIGIIIKDDFRFGFKRVKIGIIQICFNFLCFSWARGRQDRPTGRILIIKDDFSFGFKRVEIGIISLV
jgi:hypothetical protein